MAFPGTRQGVAGSTPAGPSQRTVVETTPFSSEVRLSRFSPSVDVRRSNASLLSTPPSTQSSNIREPKGRITSTTSPPLASNDLSPSFRVEEQPINTVTDASPHSLKSNVNHKAPLMTSRLSIAGDGTVRVHATVPVGGRSQYTGEMHEATGVFDGIGRLSVGNSSVFYEGEWRLGVRCGQGVAADAQGGIYSGSWQKGKQDGQGTYTEPNGNRYVGSWRDGMRHGYGVVFVCATGESISGEWYENVLRSGRIEGKRSMGLAADAIIGTYEGQLDIEFRRYGYGIQHYEGGSFAGCTYAGDWCGDVRHGQGVMTMTNGDVIDCHWKHGRRAGRGTITRSNGDVIVAIFKNGSVDACRCSSLECGDGNYSGELEPKTMLPHGHGKMRYHDGNEYCGAWVHGQRHGPGVMTTQDGTTYDGIWNQNQRHGYGILKTKNGGNYSGSWVHNHRHGSGNAVFDDGSKYDGGWDNDMMHGKGVFTGAVGRSLYRGQFSHNHRVGRGIQIYVDGISRYVGRQHFGRWHGRGYYFHAQTKVIIEGSWFVGRDLGPCRFIYLSPPAMSSSSASVSKVAIIEGVFYLNPPTSNLTTPQNMEQALKCKRYFGDDYTYDCTLFRGWIPTSQRKTVPFLSISAHQLDLPATTPWFQVLHVRGYYQQSTENKNKQTYYYNRGLQKGDWYWGEWIDGCMSGIGVYLGRDGRSWIGQMKNNLPNGIGRLWLPNGDYYHGCVCNGRPDGAGTIITHQGDFIQGTWTPALDDSEPSVLSGRAWYRWANNDEYIGNFHQGKMHGCGVLNVAGIAKIEGEWSEGVITTGRLYLPDGDVYTGALSPKHLPHGAGSLYSIGSRLSYTGQFYNGQMTGIGSRRYDCGSVYSGQFIDGSRTGTGSIVIVDGSRYDGDWKDDEWHGIGQWTLSLGTVWKGTFSHGRPVGRGCWTYPTTSSSPPLNGIWLPIRHHHHIGYPLCLQSFFVESGPFNGCRYVGDWCQGRFHGKGTMYLCESKQWTDIISSKELNKDVIWASLADLSFDERNRFDCEMVHGDVTRGMLYSSDGFRVERESWSIVGGSIFNINGNARCWRDDGSTYYGEWLQDLPHGSGTLTLPNGDTYIGEFQYGVFHGRGEYVWTDNRRYRGDWISGVASGYGTLTSSVDQYQGSWLKGRFHGVGTIINKATNERYDGEFSHGARCGIGKYMYADGSYYDGEWMDNLRHGNGCFVYEHGDVYDGEWVDGRQCGPGSSWLKRETKQSIATRLERYRHSQLRSDLYGQNERAAAAAKIQALIRSARVRRDIKRQYDEKQELNEDVPLILRRQSSLRRQLSFSIGLKSPLTNGDTDVDNSRLLPLKRKLSCRFSSLSFDPKLLPIVQVTVDDENTATTSATLSPSKLPFLSLGSTGVMMPPPVTESSSPAPLRISCRHHQEDNSRIKGSRVLAAKLLEVDAVLRKSMENKTADSNANHMLKSAAVLHASEFECYEGLWHKGKRHGHGAYSFLSGSSYIGEFSSNLRQGRGCMTFARKKSGAGDCVQWDGMWDKGVQAGHGVAVYADGRKGIGKWEGVASHGVLRYVLPSIHQPISKNYCFIQELEMDQHQGPVHIYTSTIHAKKSVINKASDEESRLRLILVLDGPFTSPKCFEHGKYYYTNGDIYVGPLQNNQPHGRGLLQLQSFASGPSQVSSPSQSVITMAGEWVNGEVVVLCDSESSLSAWHRILPSRHSDTVPAIAITKKQSNICNGLTKGGSMLRNAIKKNIK